MFYFALSVALTSSARSLVCLCERSLGAVEIARVLRAPSDERASAAARLHSKVCAANESGAQYYNPNWTNAPDTCAIALIRLVHKRKVTLIGPSAVKWSGKYYST